MELSVLYAGMDQVVAMIGKTFTAVCGARSDGIQMFVIGTNVMEYLWLDPIRYYNRVLEFPWIGRAICVV